VTAFTSNPAPWSVCSSSIKIRGSSSSSKPTPHWCSHAEHTLGRGKAMSDYGKRSFPPRNAIWTAVRPAPRIGHRRLAGRLGGGPVSFCDRNQYGPNVLSRVSSAPRRWSRKPQTVRPPPQAAFPLWPRLLGNLLRASSIIWKVLADFAFVLSLNSGYGSIFDWASEIFVSAPVGD
jgi:hypothetical protein